MTARSPPRTTAYRSCTVQPTQMSLYSQFSRSIRSSLSVASFFFSLRIFIWARYSTYTASSYLGTMYLSENSILNFSFGRSSMLFLFVVVSWCFGLKFFSMNTRQPLDYQKSQKTTCDLLLSKPCELPTGAFFQSRNSSKSVLSSLPALEVSRANAPSDRERWEAAVFVGLKRQGEFWQNTIGEFSICALWVREPP